MLILPTEAADARLSRRFENRDRDGFAMDAAFADIELVLSDSLQGCVVDGLDEAVAEGVESGAQGSNVFGIGDVLLSLRNQRAVIDDGAEGDGVCAIVDGDGGGDEIAVGIEVAGADFGELAGAAADGILVAVHAGSGIKYRAQTGACIVRLFEIGLVDCIRVAGGFCNAVADALRALILGESRGVKACWRLGRTLLSNTSEAEDHYTYQ